MNATAKTYLEVFQGERPEALAQGHSHYWTGRPCIHGHVAPRKTSDRNCVDCTKARAPEKNARGREQRRLHAKESRAADPQKFRDQKSKWREANKEKVAQGLRESYLRRKEKVLAYQKEWRAKNPEKVRENLAKRRVRKVDGMQRLPRGFFKQLGELQKWKCIGCLTDIKATYEVDHITPLAKGGRHEAGNLQLLCMPCNREKKAKDPIDWAQQTGRLL